MVWVIADKNLCGLAWELMKPPCERPWTLVWCRQPNLPRWLQRMFYPIRFLYGVSSTETILMNGAIRQGGACVGEQLREGMQLCGEDGWADGFHVEP